MNVYIIYYCCVVRGSFSLSLCYYNVFIRTTKNNVCVCYCRKETILYTCFTLMVLLLYILRVCNKPVKSSPLDVIMFVNFFFCSTL